MPSLETGIPGTWLLLALVPNSASETCFLYREVDDAPIPWWAPLEMKSEVERWLEVASGNWMCLLRFLDFISVLESSDQVRFWSPMAGATSSP